MRVSEGLIQKVNGVVKQGAGGVSVDGVYLYGSQIRGNAVSSSDVDVAMVLSDKEKVKRLDYSQLYNLFSDIFPGQEVDLRLVTRDSSPLFLFQMLKYGECLYAPSESARIDLEVNIMRQYYDTQHLRDIYHQYLVKSIKNKTYGRK